MKIIDKIAYVCVRDGRVLCARSQGKDVFYIPGGKRDPGETDEQTLAREVREELSASVRAGTEKRYGTFEAQAHGKDEGVLVRTTCYTAEIAGTPEASAEIEELAWLGYAERDRVSPVNRLIFEDLHRKGLLR